MTSAQTTSFPSHVLDSPKLGDWAISIPQPKWVVLWKLLEFFVLFAGIPIALYRGWIPNWPMPLLMAGAGLGWLCLHLDRRFDLAHIWNPVGMGNGLWPVIIRAGMLSLLLGAVVALFMPHMLFLLVRRTPWLWGSLMLFYPFVSVLPQEFLYRTVLFHRYRDVFPSETARILSSAAAFGFVHIIFDAWISVALALVGGLLFGLTYARTRSLLLVCLEHTMLGNAIFTFGLGQFFYHGGVRWPF